MRVEAQNVLGSLERDLLSATDKFGGPFTPVGFYYRTMIRPRRAWPLYEKFLRSVAGLGKIDKHSDRQHRYDVEHRRAGVLVIGGGRAGMQAAGGRRRESTLGRRRGSRHVTARTRASRCSRLHERRDLRGRPRPGRRRRILYRFRAEHSSSRPEPPRHDLPGKDLVGVMLPAALAVVNLMVTEGR